MIEALLEKQQQPHIQPEPNEHNQKASYGSQNHTGTCNERVVDGQKNHH